MHRNEDICDSESTGKYQTFRFNVNLEPQDEER